MLISKLKTLTVALVLAVAVLGGGWFAGDRGGAVFAQAAAEPGAARSLPAKNISGFSVEYTVEFIVQFEGEAKPVAMPRGTAPVGQRLSLRIQDMRTTKERLPTEVGWEVEVLRERGNDVLVAFRVEKKLRGADAIVRGQSLEFEDFVALGAWKDINDPALGMSCKLKVSPANVSAQPAPAPAVTLPPSARRPLSDPKKQTDEAASVAPAEDRVLRIFELTHERMPAFAARLKELKPGLVFAGTAGDTSGKKLGVLARAQEMEQIAALIGKLDVPAQPGAAAPPAAAPLAVAPPAAAPLAEVAASAISPDGRRMALATKDDVMLLDTQTGRLLARTTGGAGAGPVRAVAFSPDGKLIASGSHGGTVALLDSATGKVLRQAKVGRPITIVVFTPDGATLTITTTDMVQHLLDMITGTLKRGADETKPRR